ncbi:MAG TPA: response regulator [Longimicrobiales bacterium]
MLVVEDNEDNLLIVATILRHFGYDVLTAADGEAALDTARTQLPDLILLDISLPKLDGWQVARALKADARTQAMPIIAFTAHAYQADRTRATDEGFVGFLTKPVEPLRIVDEVRRIVGPAN